MKNSIELQSLPPKRKTSLEKIIKLIEANKTGDEEKDQHLVEAVKWLGFELEAREYENTIEN